MIIAVLSDIHGNISALSAVMDDLEGHYRAEGLVLLGDIIDYGQHSNEVIQYILEKTRIGERICPLLCNIFGNHEDAACNHTGARFSSDRTRACAAHTRESLSSASWDYIKNDMKPEGRAVFEAGGLRFLAVHGSIEDPLWGKLTPEISTGLALQPEGSALDRYRDYDVVLSGHTHLPHCFEGYVPAEDPVFRNRKKIIFINPGSVGQPRNHNSMSQYAVFDTASGHCDLRKVSYDIQYEADAFDGSVDDFYRRRLFLGI